MGFLLALLSFVVAEEVVELEPVQAGYDIKCPTITSKSICNAYPWCWWSGGQCYNDTCLKAIADDAPIGDCNPPGMLAPCAIYSEDYLTYDDVCANKNSPVVKKRKFCRNAMYVATLSDVGHIGQCAYEYIKSGNVTCDKWLCQELTSTTNFKYCGDRLAPGNRNTCSDLNTEEYCKLNPYCYWNSSSTGCISDRCTTHVGSGITCSDFTDQGGQTGTPIVCGSFEIYDGLSSTAGATKTLCVTPNKNAAPNKCYDLAEGGTAAANRPSTGSAECLTYSLPKCAANTECVAQIGTTGPYANYYCGDAIHLSPNSSVLAHIPAFLILLLAVLFAL